MPPEVVQSLRELPGELGCEVVKRTFWHDWVYIKGSTLHIHTLYYIWQDELSLVLLTTHLRLVKEVRLHTFQITHYRTETKTYVKIVSAPWETVKAILLFFDLGWNKDGERAIKVTFDDFLRPVLEAQRAKKPYGKLIKGLPEEEVERISSYYSTPKECLGSGGSSLIVYGYTTESDHEVDVEG